MIIEPKREILLGPLMRIGLMRCWAARDHFIRLAVVPLAAMVAVLVPLQTMALDVMMTASGDAGVETVGGPEQDLSLQFLLLGLCYAAAVNVFAVNWLRQLTLGSTAVPGLGLSLTGRHLRFLLMIIAISFVTGLAGMFLALVLGTLGMAGIMAALMVGLLFWAALLARLSPSWIGIAIDTPMPLATAWRRTTGQSYKLVIAMLAVEVPLALFQQIIEGVFRMTGLIDAAPLTFTVIVAATQLMGVAVQLAILVSAYPHFLRETV